uniref:Carbohydrate sulfotransferase n=1 Tax=Strongyloides venezuelensis TaxID=75913 RepID=A0A0K0F3C0_STRVS
MCTVMSELLCLLDYPNLYINDAKITDKSYTNRTCKKVNEKNTIDFIHEPNTKPKTNNPWIYLMIIRNPIDRFISGFLDRCDNDRIDTSDPQMCYGCNRSLSCAINKVYERMSALFFDKYSLKKNPDDYHFFPQTWRCNLEEQFNLFTFLNYSQPTTFYPSLARSLLKNNVENKVVDRILYDLQYSRTSHATIRSEKRKKVINTLYNDPDLMGLLLGIYYYDFITFNFTIPNFNYRII